MDNGLRVWIARHALRNHWRVASFIDLDDLIQEGHLCYARVRRKYPSATEPRHIQALVSRAFINSVHNLAARRERYPDHVLLGPDELAILSDDHGLECADARMGRLIAEAPPPINNLLRALLGPGDAMGRPFSRRRNGIRETTNDRFCRLIGLDARRVDVHSMLLAYLRRTLSSPARYVVNEDRLLESIIGGDRNG